VVKVDLLMPMAGNATGAMAQILDQFVGDKFVATSYNTLTATPAGARKEGEAGVKRSAFMNTIPRADGKLAAEKSASTTSPPLEIFLASNAASADTVGGSLARLATCVLLSFLSALLFSWHAVPPARSHKPSRIGACSPLTIQSVLLPIGMHHDG
jgi:hypothetical protein